MASITDGLWPLKKCPYLYLVKSARDCVLVRAVIIPELYRLYLDLPYKIANK